jgi:hypothetical protein
MQFVRLHVKGVDDSIVTNSQPKTCAANQPVMMKLTELPSKFVQLFLNSPLHHFGQLEESSLKSRVKNLRGRAHSGLPHTAANALFHVSLGLADLSLEFRSKLQFVLHHIVQKIAHLPHVLDRQLTKVRLDLLNRSHTQNDVPLIGVSQVDLRSLNRY